MLFLVISHPRPERPSEVASSRQAYWSWIEPKLASGEARSAYPRVGRGVAATFDVYPLVDTDAAKAVLQSK